MGWVDVVFAPSWINISPLLIDKHLGPRMTGDVWKVVGEARPRAQQTRIGIVRKADPVTGVEEPESATDTEPVSSAATLRSKPVELPEEAFGVMGSR